MTSGKHPNKKIKTEKENEENPDVDPGMKREIDEKRETKENKRDVKREKKEKEDKKELREKDMKEKRESKLKDYSQREKEVKEEKVIEFSHSPTNGHIVCLIPLWYISVGLIGEKFLHQCVCSCFLIKITLFQHMRCQKA